MLVHQSSPINDVLTPVNQRTIGNVFEEYIWYDTDTQNPNAYKKGEKAQTGTGVIASAYEFAKGVDNLAFGPLGTAASNLGHRAFNENPDWKPGFSYERHMFLPTKYGMTRANWAGPGTKVDQRVARGDQGVDGPRGIDIAARQHDLDYTSARTRADIRRADDTFINRVKTSSGHPIAKNLVVGAMKAKKFAENIGVASPEDFTDLPGLKGEGLAGLTRGKKEKKKSAPVARLRRKMLRASRKQS